MRALLLLFPLTAVACATPAKPQPELDRESPPHQPTVLHVRDGRANAQGMELRDGLQLYAERELRRLGVPEGTEADSLDLQIDVVEISTVWGNGAPRSCVKLQGRVIRGGQVFASTDVPSERCTGDDRYAAFVDLAVLAELSDPKHAPTPQGQLLVQALDPLIAQLANRCR